MNRLKELVMSHRAGLVITIGVTTLMIYDLWEVLLGGTGSSVSNYLVQAGFTSPVMVFGAGFLMGHLFGAMRLETVCKECKKGEE